MSHVGPIIGQKHWQKARRRRELGDAWFSPVLFNRRLSSTIGEDFRCDVAHIVERTDATIPESSEMMRTNDFRNHVFRLVASSAISIVLGLVGREISRSVRRARTRKRIEHKLDTALEQSMDCSDPVAQY